MGSRIKSPAQLAAESAPPAASLIAVPVQKLTLSADVITRGTVRHRSPVKVNLAASALKPNAAGLVTLAPQKGAQLDEGSLALAVGGRPVLVLQGAVPAFRDLAVGSTGDDVKQLEEGLKRMGFDPGSVDGNFDVATALAVAAWYQQAGWPVFAATEQQRVVLAAAKDASTKARQTRLQADLAVAQAQRQLDVEQTAALSTLAAAKAKAPNTSTLVGAARRAVGAAKAAAGRDEALATADVTSKTAALHFAEVARSEAQSLAKTPPPGATAAELAALQAAVAKASEVAVVAASDLAAGQAALGAAKVAGTASVQRAGDDVVVAERDSAAADDDVSRAQTAVDAATARVAAAPPDVTLLRQSAEVAKNDEAVTAADLLALAERIAVQVPADEILFLPDLPRRVDEVKVKRGDQVSAELMTVSGLSLSIDAALSAGDAKLVTTGAKVAVEEPDLGVSTTGVVTVRADQPGTNAVDAQKFYLEVTPDNAPASLVGASVKLTIPVKSTAGDVLAVPLSALTVGASGATRVEVIAGTTTRFLEVRPGLVAEGLVEVSGAGGGLAAGDNVVVGRGNERPVPAGPTGATNPPAPASTALPAVPATTATSASTASTAATAATSTATTSTATTSTDATSTDATSTSASSTSASSTVAAGTSSAGTSTSKTSGV